MRRWARSGAILLLVLAAIFAPACQQSRPSPGAPPSVPTPAGGPMELPTSAPVAGLSGSLVFTLVVDMRAYDLATGATRTILRFPNGAYGGTPAASPDGSLIAWALYTLGRGKEPGGTDLYVAGADASNTRIVLAHDTPGTALSEPAWTPDGRALYFTRRPREGGSHVERVNLDGSGRELVVRDAFSPWISPDGKRLLYLTVDQKTVSYGLWVSGLDGSNPTRLLGSPEFAQLGYPRWSPDGSRIVFGAVSAQDSVPVPGAPRAPTSWLEPPVAHAHGIPWDLWLVNADGSGQKRITNVQEDSPVPTWSPDGEWIAFGGELGLYLTDSDGTQLRRLTEQPSNGGVTWLR